MNIHNSHGLSSRPDAEVATRVDPRVKPNSFKRYTTRRWAMGRFYVLENPSQEKNQKFPIQDWNRCLASARYFQSGSRFLGLSSGFRGFWRRWWQGELKCWCSSDTWCIAWSLVEASQVQKECEWCWSGLFKRVSTIWSNISSASILADRR